MPSAEELEAILAQRDEAEFPDEAAFASLVAELRSQYAPEPEEACHGDDR